MYHKIKRRKEVSDLIKAAFSMHEELSLQVSSNYIFDYVKENPDLLKNRQFNNFYYELKRKYKEKYDE